MESERCIIDSSIFVAFYRDIDSHHTHAMRLMEEIADQTLVVHPYVIQETATVLSYRVSLLMAHKFLTDIVEADNVIIPAVDARYDIGRFLAANQRMSFTDIALVELARTTGARIISFDEQLLSLVGKADKR